MLKIYCEMNPENKDLVDIYVDDQQWRIADKTILGKKPELPTECMSLPELEKWYETLEYRGAKRYAYKRLSLRNTPSFELNNLLTSKLVSEKICQKVIQELVELGYVNDQDWAQAFIKHHSDKKKGPKAIAYKLKNKGYRADDVSSLLEDVNKPDVQKQTIIKLMETRYRSKDISDRQQRGKVIAALLRKGFDFEIILHTLSFFTFHNRP
jgi:regulatory protein